MDLSLTGLKSNLHPDQRIPSCECSDCEEHLASSSKGQCVCVDPSMMELRLILSSSPDWPNLQAGMDSVLKKIMETPLLTTD